MPDYWKNTLNSDFDEKIKLSSDNVLQFQHLLDVTFKERATKDRSGGLPDRLKVVQVVRIEDHKMWQRYAAKRGQLAQRSLVPLVDLPGSGRVKTAQQEKDDGGMPPCLGHVDDKINEVFLFHGTAPSGAIGIGEDGFDLSMAGSNVGTMFGAGAYFAEASSKSDEYSTEEPSGVFSGKRALLLCRVTLGNMFYITHSDIPAIEDALAIGKYHSVLGDREKAVGSYRGFVVFDQDQIYPEYAIIYEREF